MKILLVGEYSGLHMNLAKGLRALGHVVVTISDGDNFKDFPRDVDISGNSFNSNIYTIKRIFKEIKAAYSFSGFDIVQFINPLVFSRFGPCIHLNNKLISKNEKSFLLAAGDDYYYWKAYRAGIYKYSPHKDFLSIDGNGANTNLWETARLRKINLDILKNVNGVIPCATEYKLAYTNTKKLKDLIPFPIDLEKIDYKKNVISLDGKIRILHGVQLSRAGFKGTRLIDMAMQKLLAKYPNLIEYYRPVSLPFNEYIKLLNAANIVIDQVHSFSPAMNALTAMAMGKVVVGGAETEYLRDMGINNCPLVNIRPEPDHIYTQIENLILSPGHIPTIGDSSRRYVEDHYDCYLVAQKYINVWQSN
jgi:glycosyltransferase involved in cell wall biosynthesis